jgi:hypothetical protein
MNAHLLVPFFLCVGALSVLGGQDAWDKDVGKPAPALIPSAWLGTPVGLDHVRGNTIIIAFWNADIAC